MAKKRDYKTDIKVELLSLGYDIISNDDEYVNMTTNIRFRCNECGKIFERKTNTIISQKLFYCSYCSKRISCGEREIIDILNKNNINYVHQKTFDDCKNKLPLPFNFYLPDKNILIEYDGELHYKDVFGNLERQKENDDIKNKYCKENNITLIRIPYWENIEDSILKIIYGYTVSSQLEITERCND